MTIGTRLSWDGGLGLATDTSGGEFEPDVASPPTPLGARQIVAQAIQSVTIAGAEVTPTVVTAEAAYQTHRIVVGGKDITYFRGVQTPLPNYGLTSPLMYGSGSITFPQIHAAYERPGHGDLAWLSKFAPVKIQRVNADGTVHATDYRGFISDFDHQGRTLSCTLGGQATGLAAMMDRPVPIFPRIQDVGVLVMETIQHGLRLATANQPTTGINLLNTGGGSVLDFLTEVLAKSTQKDGDQWTVMPNVAGAYRMFQKDTTTISASVYIDGFRVSQSLRRDFTEEPNRLWAQGVGPDGQRIRFAIYPGLPSPGASAPSFPGTLSPGDSGDGVTALAWQLYTVGYLDNAPFSLTWTTAGDDPLTEAIEDLQDDAGLSQTGVVNAATWKAMFNPDITGYSLNRAVIKPAAQKNFTKPFLLDSTGNVIGHNPEYVKSIPYVDATVSEMTGFTRRQLQGWSKRELADENAANWVGTVTVNTGAVIDGEHHPGDALTTDLVRDARSIKPGMNLLLSNWDGGTLVHVSGVDVAPGSVTYTVDTRARDTMKVWEVIARNRESRKSPSRQWIAQNRRSGMRDDTVAFYDGGSFGRIPRTFCPANQTTVIATPAGRSGILQKVDIQTDTDAAAFSLAIFGRQVSSGWCDRKLGDWTDTGFVNKVATNTKAWQDNRGLVDIWGSKDQPCGYWPRQHTDATGTTTDATITGEFRFTAGTPYLCQGAPVLWIAIRPDRDCYVEGGRVLELLLDDSAG